MKNIIKWIIGIAVMMVMSVAVEIIYYAVDCIPVTIGGYTMDLSLVAVGALCIGTTILAVNWLRNLL